MADLEKFMKAMGDVTKFILGEKRNIDDRRVKKVKKKPNHRNAIRRK